MSRIIDRIYRRSAGGSLSMAGSNNNEVESVATFEFDMEMVHESPNSRRGSWRGRRKTAKVVLDSSDMELGASAAQPDEKDSVDELLRAPLYNEGDDNNAPFFESAAHATVRSSFPSFGGSSINSGFSWLSSNRTFALSLAIGTMGVIASSLFLGFGIRNAVDDAHRYFNIRATELAQEFNRTWESYEIAALWVYESCFFHDASRKDFNIVYHYVMSHVLVESIQYAPRIYDNERQAFEEGSLKYYSENFPEIQNLGITDFSIETSDNGISSGVLFYREQADFYQPVHLLEPLDNITIPSINFDILVSELHRDALEFALSTGKPTATRSYRRLLKNGELTADSFIELLHPGISVHGQSNVGNDVAVVTVRIKTFMKMAAEFASNEDMSVFLYDSTIDDTDPPFILAVEVYQGGHRETGEKFIFKEQPISLSKLKEETRFFLQEHTTKISSRTWTLVVVALPDTFTPDLRYIILAGKFIMISTFCVVLWMLTSYRRTKTVLELKRRAEVEKTALIVRSARTSARAEQELNDYIAHEVRNPLAAAISACNFVKSSVNERYPMNNPKTLQAIREDVDIIDSSLTFTHDLLSSMLDMHRAASKDLTIQETPLDVLRDVLEPVGALLYSRNLQFEVITECDEGLFILSDRLRLKQILLNLSRNAVRYIQKGYIKIGASVVDNNVRFFVEDTGYGISEARRKNLFAKFQESLEIMDQGSGMSLCLCKSMVKLLQGDIWLDEQYNSGIPGSPGSRFVVSLNKGPMTNEEVKDKLGSLDENSDRVTVSTYDESRSNTDIRNELSVSRINQPMRSLNEGLNKSPSSSLPATTVAPEAPLYNSKPAPATSKHNARKANRSPEEFQDLPKNLSVLFVDDDTILRKLFMRSLRNIVEEWDIQEAASGEAALKLVDDKDFDIIFMDQYMASVEKKLLGTETVRAMRSKGVSCKICGLSANDVEEGFIESGADCFMFKPFPCKKEQLTKELLRILSAGETNTLTTGENPDGSSSASLTA